MRVEVEEDGMGNIILTPVSKKVRAQMRKHNKEWHGHADDTVFLQAEADTYAFKDMLPRAKRREVEEGYTVVIQMDPWIFGHYVGYDFHEVIDP
jgi:hypothetical protein